MKKQISNEKTAEAERVPRFTKEQVLSSQKYLQLKDAVNTVLESNKEYTLEEVDSAIKSFMKGEVE